MKTFKKGAWYQATENLDACGGLFTVPDDGKFQCCAVDADGDCWSDTPGVTFEGKQLYDGEGWCVASQEELNNGAVIGVGE